MFGYGKGYRGYGHGPGYGHGQGFGHDPRWSGPAAAQVPEGYRYVGPCRCGWGPNAFYQDASGRMVHAWDVYRWGRTAGSAPTREVLKQEFEFLKAQKEDLERRLAELEKRLKEETEEPEK